MTGKPFVDTHKSVHIVHLGDSHIGDNDDYRAEFTTVSSASSTEALVSAVLALPFRPDMIVHTGDITAEPSALAYERARHAFSRLQSPLLFLPGNHDDLNLLQRHLLLCAHPKRHLYHEFVREGIRFVFLDTSSSNPGCVRGGVDQAQLEWLKGLCEDETPMVVFAHHNIVAVGNEWLDEFMRLTEGERLHETLIKGRARTLAVFFGHVHQNLQVVSDGIFYCSVASSWTQFASWPGQKRTAFDPKDPPGFNVITAQTKMVSVRQWRVFDSSPS